MSSLLNYEITRTGIFELDLKVPEGLSIDSVESPALRTYRVDAASHKLIVSLNEKQQGSIALTVTGHRDMPAAGDVDLPLLEPLGTFRETGLVGAFAPEGIELVADDSKLAGRPSRAARQPAPSARHASRGKLVVSPSPGDDPRAGRPQAHASHRADGNDDQCPAGLRDVDGPRDLPGRERGRRHVPHRGASGGRRPSADPVGEWRGRREATESVTKRRPMASSASRSRCKRKSPAHSRSWSNMMSSRRPRPTPPPSPASMPAPPRPSLSRRCRKHRGSRTPTTPIACRSPASRAKSA